MGSLGGRVYHIHVVYPQDIPRSDTFVQPTPPIPWALRTYVKAARLVCQLPNRQTCYGLIPVSWLERYPSTLTSVARAAPWAWSKLYIRTVGASETPLKGGGMGTSPAIEGERIVRQVQTRRSSPFNPQRLYSARRCCEAY